MPKLKISSKEFTEFLLNQVPKFDEMILADIRPTEGWLLETRTGVFPDAEGEEEVICQFPDWYWTQEKVRKISEGTAFESSEWNPGHVPKRLPGFRNVPVKFNNLRRR